MTGRRVVEKERQSRLEHRNQALWQVYSVAERLCLSVAAVVGVVVEIAIAMPIAIAIKRG